MKIGHFIPLAPVLYLDTILTKISLYHLLARFKVIDVLEFFKITNFPIVDPSRYFIIDKTSKIVCRNFSFICKFIFYIISDSHPDLLDIENMSKYLKYYPSNSSVKSLRHFVQFIESEKPEFKKFDYGESKNLVLYGQKTPPLYDITKVKI